MLDIVPLLAIRQMLPRAQALCIARTLCYNNTLHDGCIRQMACLLHYLCLTEISQVGEAYVPITFDDAGRHAGAGLQ